MRTISYLAAAAVTIAGLLAAATAAATATGQVKVMVNAGIRALLTITS